MPLVKNALRGRSPLYVQYSILCTVHLKGLKSLSIYCTAIDLVHIITRRQQLFASNSWYDALFWPLAPSASQVLEGAVQLSEMLGHSNHGATIILLQVPSPSAQILRQTEVTTRKAISKLPCHNGVTKIPVTSASTV